MRYASSEKDLEKIKAEAELSMRAEMEQMILQKDASAEEKDKIRRAMEEQSIELELQLEEAQRDRVKRDETEKKLCEMEGKLIHGVDELEARNMELEQIALEKERQLEMDASENTQQQRKIEQLEKEAQEKQKTFYTKKDQVTHVTQKLKNPFSKYQSAKSDLEQHARALRREKEDMLDSINLLRRQLLLKETLIECFCPSETVKKVQKFSVWEDDAERWVLEAISGRDESMGDAISNRNQSQPQSDDITDTTSTRNPSKKQLTNKERKQRGLRATVDPDSLRPICDRARVSIALGDKNPRHTSENILHLPLDIMERTTFDLFGEEVQVEYGHESEDPRDVARNAANGVQAVLDIAFSNEGGARLAPYAGSTKSTSNNSRHMGKATQPRAAQERPGKTPGPRLVRPASAKRRV